VGLGLIVELFFISVLQQCEQILEKGCFRVTTENVVTVSPVEEKSTATIPFKNNEFDYAELLAWTGEGYEVGLGDFYPGSYFIITAVSNATDGIDGLSRYLSNLCFSIGIFTFVSGNIIF
jgi:phospho-N-acetylmuramoyl-pentapeptide-transferase